MGVPTHSEKMYATYTWEKVVLPAIKENVGVMLGDKAPKQIDLIPLSDNTVQRRIEEMASNVKDQLISRIKASNFLLFSWTNQLT